MKHCPFRAIREELHRCGVSWECKCEECEAELARKAFAGPNHDIAYVYKQYNFFCWSEDEEAPFLPTLFEEE
jgi:hypothetical protein